MVGRSGRHDAWSAWFAADWVWGLALTPHFGKISLRLHAVPSRDEHPIIGLAIQPGNSEGWMTVLNEIAELAPLSDFSTPAVKASSSPLLRFAWLELTQNCNLRFRHCYLKSSPASAHGSVDWRAVMRELRDLDCRSIQFIGGEPTRHPQFLALLNDARLLGFGDIEIYTNLCDSSPALINAIDSAGARVATSFYSADAATHDRVTLSPGSFEETCAGIRAVCARGIALRVGLIDHSGDPDECSAAIALLQTLGVDRAAVRIDRVRQVGRAAVGCAVSDPDAELCGRCGIARIAIAHDGECFPCVFARHRPWGKIGQTPLADIVARRVGHARDAPSRTLNGPCTPHGDPGCTPWDEPGGPCNPVRCLPLDDPPKCGPDFG